MALSYKARRRLSLLILLVGMPLYIVAAVTVVNLFDRPPLLVELVVYVGLGFLWIAAVPGGVPGDRPAGPCCHEKGAGPAGLTPFPSV